MSDMPTLENLLPPIYANFDQPSSGPYYTPATEKRRYTSLPATAGPGNDVQLPSFGEVFAQYLPRPSSVSPSPESVPSSPDSATFSPPLAAAPLPSPPSPHARPCPSPLVMAEAAYCVPALISPPVTPVSEDTMDLDDTHLTYPAPVPPVDRPYATTPVWASQYLHGQGLAVYDALEYLAKTDPEFRRQLLDRIATRASIWRQSLWHTIYDISPTVLDKLVGRIEEFYPSPAIPLVKPDQAFYDALKLLIKRLIVATQ
ncbi:hypothetical protein IWQ60_002213 [Tieghemiomyces parasiticus]|uniref:Uncharacterized protein n=1 Tax=Tieghemiomyces parasiticus TaxID=78921 RepID=A0A9W8DXL5_9FUNG|nr:hypothetical protein IWQ60_002213 [Tieghemiomyces parasiticus]